MIDYNKTKEAFEKYLKNYDESNESINLKIKHSYEVAQTSAFIAKNLGLSKEDISLASIIGLLHDTGRFEQLKINNDFDDSKFEHAKFGCEFLFGKDKNIRKFISNDKYDYIIEKAIYNHNKNKIELGLDNKTLMHAQIIRDADKIDNYRVEKTTSFETSWPKIYNAETILYEKISDKIYYDFLKHKKLTITDRKTMWDYYLFIIGFVYDMQFDISKKYIKEQNYLNTLFDKMSTNDNQTKHRIKIMRKNILKYIDKY